VGGRDPGLEDDVAPQVEPVGHVVEVGEDLGLGGVALRPLPLLLQVGVEGVGVVDAFDVAPAARVAVPVPGAAHVGPGLDRHHAKALLAMLVEGVEPPEAGADDEDVDLAHTEHPRRQDSGRSG
jgi:hypothetical protein